MKRNLALISALALASAMPALAGSDAKYTPPVQPVATPENPLGVTLTVGYDSSYIFRGTEFAKDLVSGSIDWTVPLNNVFSLDLNAWYGSSASDSAVPFAGGGSYAELDLSAALLAKVGQFTIGAKYTWYDYLNRANHFVKDVNEVGATVSTTVAGFDLAVNGYYDATASGFYFEYAVARSIPITSWLSLVPRVLVSNATHYYGVDGFNNVTLSLSAPIKLCKTATLTPYIAGDIPIDSLKDLGERNHLYGGVALSVSF